MRDKKATVQDLEELPPFHSAARQGDEVQLSHLLETHPDLIDYGDGKGFTALMHAVFAKNLKCMQLLLESGSKTEVIDGKGRTALHFCARQGWSDGAKLLMLYGAQCSTTDSNGRNALHFGACSYEESCLEILLDQMGKVVINAVDCEGMTPLHWASFHNIEENVNVLLQNGAIANLLDNEQKTPLHWAAQNGCVLACRSLIRSQFCESLINQRTSDGKTALHLATTGGYLEVIFELAQGKGFAANFTDKDGRTALHWACAVGNNRCVAGLLRLGVKHNRTDNYGVTPNVYAKRLNHQDCVSLIQNYDPQRPQDVLIPVESFSDYSNSIDKISCHKEAMSNIEQDVFYRTSSRDKETSNIEKVAQVDYDKPLNAMDDLESLKDACDDALTFKVRYSDGDSNSSGDDEKAGNLVVRQDIQVEMLLSEDEMRYQPQMSVTPPNGFLHASPQLQAKKSSPKNTHNPRKKHKKPISPYKLAPIKSNMNGARIQATRDMVESPRDKMEFPFDIPESLHVQKIPKQPLTRRISAGLLDQKQNNTHEQLINVQAFRAATNKVESPKRRNGLRRKSLSFNDALIDHNVKASEKCLISRTQSYASVNSSKSTLPMIESRDGRNLTQQLHLHQSGLLNEVLDEIEPITVEESKIAFKKKKAQRKDKFSRFEL